MLDAVSLGEFGGLNLLADPIAVGATGAVDLLNVRTDSRDRARTRSGYLLYSNPGIVPYELAGISVGGSMQAVAAGASTVPVAINAAGTVVATATWSANSLARFGIPSTSRVYAAGRTAGDYGYYSGGAWTHVLGAPTARRIAVTPVDNRIAVVDGLDTITFSDAGDANTFTAGNNLKLRPGDGEALTGLVAWRDLLIAGKQTALFVFYGTSVSATGTPIFNYRTVATGVGPIDMEAVTMAAGRDAVYLLDKNGVYATTGGVPVKISGPLDPWFNGDVMPTKAFPARTGGGTVSALGCAGDFVFVSPEPDISSLTFVYHAPTQSWSAYNWAMLMAATSPFGSINGPEAMISLTDNKLYRHSSAWTTDNGTAISWSWKSGKYPLAKDRRVAITQESSLFGTGTPTLTLSSDLFADQSGSVTLGTSPTPAEGWLQKDQEARYFQHKLSGSGQATVEALTHYLQYVKPAGIE